MSSATVNFSRFVFRWLLLLLLMMILVSFQKPIKEEKNPAFSFEHNEKLQAEADALLPFFDRMQRVPVFLTDEAILHQASTNTERGAAYTHCYRKDFPIIFVKKNFYQKANRKQLVNALKHELTHAWLCRKSLMSAAGHGALFREKFTEVGGVGN